MFPAGVLGGFDLIDEARCVVSERRQFFVGRLDKFVRVLWSGVLWRWELERRDGQAG